MEGENAAGQAFGKGNGTGKKSLLVRRFIIDLSLFSPKQTSSLRAIFSFLSGRRGLKSD